MHCCHGNHILETHWYWSLLPLQMRCWGQGLDLQGPSEKRDGGERKKRGERETRGRSKRDKRGEEMERQRERMIEGRREERKEPDGLSGGS